MVSNKGPMRQQEGYILCRRSYRMRAEIVNEVDDLSRKLHCSRSALINDLLRAALRYVEAGDSLALSEIRGDLRMI